MKLRAKPLAIDGKAYAVGVMQVSTPSLIAPVSAYVWSHLAESKVGPVDILAFEWLNQTAGAPKPIPNISLRRRPDLEIDLAGIAARNPPGGGQRRSRRHATPRHRRNRLNRPSLAPIILRSPFSFEFPFSRVVAFVLTMRYLFCVWM